MLPSSLRGRIVALVILVALATAYFWVPKVAPRSLADRDFIVYYASARLAVQHHNPYDPAAIFALEKSLGYQSDHVTYAREPPWLIWTLLPFGVLPPVWGWALWVLLSVASLIAASRLCWRMQGWPPPARRPFVYSTYLFAPVLACLLTTQLGLFLMLGLVLFLALEGSPKTDFWAGAALVLPAIKPQLLSIFWIVLMVWMFHRQRWRVMLGAAFGFVAAGLIAMAFDPAVFVDWYNASVHSAEPIGPLLNPSIAGVFRAIFFRHQFWVQFVPACVGMLWGLWHYWRHRGHWSWREHGLGLAPASFLVTPYEWFTDEVLLLPAILQAMLWIYQAGAARAWRVIAAAVLIALNGLLLLMLLSKVPMPLGVYFWSSLVWFGWWRLGWRSRRRALTGLEVEPAGAAAG